MDASGYWDQSSYDENPGHNPNQSQASQLPEIVYQGTIPDHEIRHSLAHARSGGHSHSSSTSSYQGSTHNHAHFFELDEEDEDSDHIGNQRQIVVDDTTGDSHLAHQPASAPVPGHQHLQGDLVNEPPNPEQASRIYYNKGLAELESLQLLDLSPLANWKLSSAKQGCGLEQLREDSPDSFWQSDGSNGNSNPNANPAALANNHLPHPHTITIQFAKKVSLERISIFTNFLLDESYTPSKIRIMAGSSDGWDLAEVCTVTFNKPVGWSHIIFNGIRDDGVLKCFIVKIVILANHQDGKDSHIRAIRCFGKKTVQSTRALTAVSSAATGVGPNDFLKDLSHMSGLSNVSGLSLNTHNYLGTSLGSVVEEATRSYDVGSSYAPLASLDESVAKDDGEELDAETSRILGNVNEVIGYNTGFQTIQLKSLSSIR
ncbi:hypothetical protein DICA3_F14026 [Diutina catenulata]